MTDRGNVHATGWSLRTVAPELVERYRTAGWWTDEALGEVLDRGLAEHADVAFRIHSETRPWSGTFGDVRDMARAVSPAACAERGIGAGDSVAFQLPNCVEAAVVFYAAAIPRRGGRADRALLRAEGGRLHPPAHRT